MIARLGRALMVCSSILGSNFVAGCSGQSASKCSHSHPTGQCSGNDACIAGACRLACTDHGQCAGTEICSAGYCEPLVQACSGDLGDTSCPNGAFCALNGACIKQYVAGVACDDDRMCATGNCLAGVCEQGSAACAADSDCISPTRCELAAGATCQNHQCHYARFACTQVAPVNLCLAPSGTCDPSQGGGACHGQDCCVFAPLWPEGSSAP